MTGNDRDKKGRNRANRPAPGDSVTNFQNIFDSSLDGLLVADITTRRFVMCNKSICRMLGYSEQELLRLSVDDIHPKKDLPHVRAQFNRQVRNEIRLAPALPVLRKDGSVFPADVNTAHLALDGKKYLLGSFRDITERKRAEEDLLFRAAMLDNANDAIHVMDTDGRIIYCNQTMARQTGYTREELLGMHVSKLSPAPPPFARGEKEPVFAGGPPDARFETKVLRKDGTSFPAEIHARAVELDDRRMVVAVGRDITERKSMEEALKDSEARLRDIFHSALDGLLIADAATGRFIMGNRKICEMLGYSERELLRLSVRDIHPEKDLPHVREQFDRQLRGEMELAPNLPVKRKDGGIFHADINSTPLMLAGRQCLLGNFRDVTERRKAELALEQSENLHRTLIDTTDTGYVVIDDKGRVIDANSKYLSYTGYSDLGEIYGRSVLEWTAKHHLKKNGRAVAACVRDGRIRDLEIDYIDRNGKIIPIEINATTVEMDGVRRMLSLCRDITERRKSEAALKDSLKQLAEQKKLLEQKNIAFQEVIKSIELEKTAIKDNVARSVSELVMPILKRIKPAGGSAKYLDILQKNLISLTASFGREITEKTRGLTPREIEICNMIKEGLSSKEIADLVGASDQTVDKHRKNIRRKLGLSRKSNLVSFLRDL